jgi:hypothetical protein
MQPMQGEIVERLPDDGQWFEHGARIDFFADVRPGQRRLEPAILGAYEVLRCARLEAEGARWLSVTLQPFRFR